MTNRQERHPIPHCVAEPVVQLMEAVGIGINAVQPLAAGIFLFGQELFKGPPVTIQVPTNLCSVAKVIPPVRRRKRQSTAAPPRDKSRGGDVHIQEDLPQTAVISAAAGAKPSAVAVI